MREGEHAEELVGLISADLAVLLSERFTADTSPGDAPVRVRDNLSRLGAGNRFVGRHRELEALRKLLTHPQQTRLMTLVGPGGTGKTRLALEAVARVAPAYEAVATVDLDKLSSAPLVAPAIAAALEVPEAAGLSLLDSVVGTVGSHRILLVLDSFEHVMDAAPVVAELVARTSRLVTLVTSRESLRLTGERVFEVPPLGVPAWSDSTDVAKRSDSVRLFADRAAAAGAHLRLDADEVRTISDICRSLDGLPLAIELAASRTRMLGLEDLLRRLDRSLTILTAGARDLPARQRTLESAIAWSYNLLDEPDRKLFGCLGVFTGSFTLDAADAICAIEDVPSVFDGVSSLVDRASLRPVHSPRGTPRFDMLRVVRQFATARLEEAGEADRLRRRHAEYFRRQMLDAGVAILDNRATRPLVEQYVADQDNGRAAMQWFLAAGDGDSAVRMGSAIWPLLFTLALSPDVQDAMEAALGSAGGLSDDNRANARLVLGMMAFDRGDCDRAVAALRPAFERYDESGDERGAASVRAARPRLRTRDRSPGAGRDRAPRGIRATRT